jgi:hypothetical protein
MGISVYGQVKETTNPINSKNGIVINHKMIEKFRNAEYSENQVSFTDLYTMYSFESVKVIALAYHNGEITTTTIDEIDSYLARVEKEYKENNQLELYSEKKTLASNQ